MEHCSGKLSGLCHYQDFKERRVSIASSVALSLPGNDDLLPTERQHHRVIFQPAGRQGEIVAGTSLLEAARQLGVEIESICGGRQTCSKCQVRVEEGYFARYGVEAAADHVSG